MPTHHIVLIDGFRAIERREYSDDIVGICLDDQREFALRNRKVGKHIVLTHLSLIGNGDIYSAVTSFYTSGTIGFPKVLILLQGRVEVEEIEQIVICLFHIFRQKIILLAMEDFTCF